MTRTKLMVCQSFVVLLGLMGAVLSFLSAPGEAYADARESIVKIYTSHNSPDYFNPWSMLGPRTSSGSGAIISGSRVLTNAHVVSDHTFIQVRKYGDARRYPARVLHVAHELDLALLLVEEEAFFEGTKALSIGKLPFAQQEVIVYGFPLGGDTLSITRGVVSRIEHQNYYHSSSSFLVGQIDASINPGNSGGPVLVDGKIVGVVMQAVSAQSAENVGYMIPVPVIEHFLADLEDGTLHGMPALGIRVQTLENPALKKYVGLDEKAGGILVTNVLAFSGLNEKLAASDVILSVDGHAIANDGTVEFRPKERTHFTHFLQLHQRGDTISLEVFREGKRVTIKETLSMGMPETLLVPGERYDVTPRYYMYGGFVFAPLTKNLLRRWGQEWFDRAPKRLTAALTPNMPKERGEEVVVLLKVLASDFTRGYNDYTFWVIKRCQGVEIKNVSHLKAVIDATPDTEPFMLFEDEDGGKLVLDHSRAKAELESILTQYRIPAAMSDDLR